MRPSTFLFDRMVMPGNSGCDPTRCCALTLPRRSETFISCDAVNVWSRTTTTGLVRQTASNASSSPGDAVGKSNRQSRRQTPPSVVGSRAYALRFWSLLEPRFISRRTSSTKRKYKHFHVSMANAGQGCRRQGRASFSFFTGPHPNQAAAIFWSSLHKKCGNAVPGELLSFLESAVPLPMEKAHLDEVCGFDFIGAGCARISGRRFPGTRLSDAADQGHHGQWPRRYSRYFSSLPWSGNTEANRTAVRG